MSNILPTWAQGPADAFVQWGSGWSSYVQEKAGEAYQYATPFVSSYGVSVSNLPAQHIASALGAATLLWGVHTACLGEKKLRATGWLALGGAIAKAALSETKPSDQFSLLPTVLAAALVTGVFIHRQWAQRSETIATNYFNRMNFSAENAEAFRDSFKKEPMWVMAWGIGNALDRISKLEEANRRRVKLALNSTD